MRREDLGVRLHLVGAGELYLRVLVGLREKVGVGRYNSTTGRKALFSTLPGKLTRKTLARAYSRIFGKRCPGLGIPAHLLDPCRNFEQSRWLRLHASPGRTSGRRDIGSGALTLFAEPTCAPLGALSLIGSSNYNHLLFTECLERDGVLGFWGICHLSQFRAI